jgi:long-subunit acyl-CoA synthetase (AMP-forming)
LPLAHIYERNTLTTAIRAGVCVGFYRGNVLELLDDVAELKPTVFTSVPRLYNRIYDKARHRLASTANTVIFLPVRLDSCHCHPHIFAAGAVSGGTMGAMIGL